MAALRIRSPQDFGAALVILLLGLVGLYHGLDYGVVEHGELGPGYFPAIVGGLMLVVSAALLFRAVSTDGEPIGRFPWRSAICLTLSLAAFAFLMADAGLVIACLVGVLIASAGQPRANWAESLLIAVLLTAFCALVFVVGLGQPLKLWPI